jgi:Protein of unknown function (DUF2690)
MIASIMNKTHTRLLLLLGVACVTMLALLMSTLAVFTPIASVHAMGLPSADPTLCVSAPTMAHCTNQDPMAQGCSRDAQTIAYEDFLDPSTGNSLARAERRYSPKCHTYWGRIVEPVTGKRGLSIVVALNGGPPQVSTTTGTEVFTQMVFLSCQTPQMARLVGAISLKNGENPTANGVSGLAALLAVTPSPLPCS